MGITVDTIQLKFNVTPSYQQQQIQQLNTGMSDAELQRIRGILNQAKQDLASGS